MSDPITGIAPAIATTQASALRETVQTNALRQQIDSERAVADLVRESVDAQRAPLTEGQGTVVDILA